MPPTTGSMSLERPSAAAKSWSLLAGFGFPEAKFEEAAIDQPERFHDRVFKMFADFEGLLGKCERLLGFCFGAHDARPHPAPQAVLPALGGAVDQLRGALVPALGNGKLSPLEMDPGEGDCRGGRAQALAGHAVFRHRARQERGGFGRPPHAFQCQGPFFEIGRQQLVGGVRLGEGSGSLVPFSGCSGRACRQDW